MKNALNILILLLCLAAGFALAKAWKPFTQWWNRPGFEHTEPTLLTGVGDAPEHRGFTLDHPLPNPNATFTNWTTTFPTYDHPHKYRIAAWAIDLDGQADTSKAQVQRICVRDQGDLTPCV